MLYDISLGSNPIVTDLIKLLVSYTLYTVSSCTSILCTESVVGFTLCTPEPSIILVPNLIVGYQVNFVLKLFSIQLRALASIRVCSGSQGTSSASDVAIRPFLVLNTPVLLYIIL